MTTNSETNKKNFLITFITTLIIASILNSIINKITGFEYNIFSDSFNISKLLLDLLINALCTMPVYLLLKKLMSLKYTPIILKAIFYTLLLLFTVLINFTDYINIGSSSNILTNVWGIVISIFGLVWGINYINKKKIGLAAFFICISSVMVFENIILVFLKTR